MAELRCNRLRVSSGKKITRTHTHGKTDEGALKIQHTRVAIGHVEKERRGLTCRLLRDVRAALCASHSARGWEEMMTMMMMMVVVVGARRRGVRWGWGGDSGSAHTDPMHVCNKTRSLRSDQKEFDSNIILASGETWWWGGKCECVHTSLTEHGLFMPHVVTTDTKYLRLKSELPAV